MNYSKHVTTEWTSLLTQLTSGADGSRKRMEPLARSRCFAGAALCAPVVLSLLIGATAQLGVESPAFLYLVPATAVTVVLWLLARWHENALRSDSSEQAQSEQRILSCAQSIADLYNHTPCGFQMVDREGTIVSMNDTQLDWLGFSRAELVGAGNISSIMTRESIQSFQRQYPLLARLDWISGVEFDMLRKDGTVMKALLTSRTENDENGEASLISSVVMDVSAQRAVEDSLRRAEEVLSLLVSEDSAIVEVSREGLITSARGAGSLTEYLGNEVVGRPISCLYSPEAISTGHPSVDLANASSYGRSNHQCELFHTDGSSIWADVSFRCLKRGDGSIEGYTAVVRDSSMLRAKDDLVAHLEQNIERRERDLTVAYAELNILTAMLLNNGHASAQASGSDCNAVMDARESITVPLETIISLSSRLADSKLSDKQHDQARLVRNLAHLLLTTLNADLDPSSDPASSESDAKRPSPEAALEKDSAMPTCDSPGRWEQLARIEHFCLAEAARLHQEFESELTRRDRRFLLQRARELKGLCGIIPFNHLLLLATDLEREVKTESWNQAQLLSRAFKSSLITNCKHVQQSYMLGADIEAA
ncbi:MAG TPA: PAS domain-containing protein [Candidatus Obscuribacterales bacterium]